MCLACEATSSSGDLLGRFRDTGQVPRCSCGGALKPNVVLFGEPLPPDALRAAQKAVARCDAMLVAGSSLTVIPVGNWPAEIVADGRDRINVNETETPLDDRATVVILGDVSEVLPAIARQAGVRVWSFRQQIRRSVNRAIDGLLPRL